MKEGDTFGIRTRVPVILASSESDTMGMMNASMGSQPPIAGDGLYVESKVRTWRTDQ